jgi:hypothetical protein
VKWSWLCRIVGHDWCESRWNAWAIATEETCPRCGAQRHHLFEDMRGFDTPAWRDGPHQPEPPK